MLIPAMVKQCLTEALRVSKEISREWPDKKLSSDNSDRSKLFLTQCFDRLDQLINPAGDLCKKLARFDHVKMKRIPGEWLLDAIWSKQQLMPDGKSWPVELTCAIECEYNKSAKEVYSDFSKLLVVAADTKIFLGGLDHITPPGAESYIQRRKAEMVQLINKSTAQNQAKVPDWYIAFWPSPQNAKDGVSIWKHLESSSSRYQHLDTIHLFHLEEGSFRQI